MHACVLNASNPRTAIDIDNVNLFSYKTMLERLRAATRWRATDTVGSATPPMTMRKLNEFEQGILNNLVLVLVADEVMCLVAEVPDAAWDLMEHLNGQRQLSTLMRHLLLGADGAASFGAILGLRHSRVGKPASTSANLTGAPTPKNFSDVSDELRFSADYVSQHRQKESDGSGLPSMIVAFDAVGRFTFLSKMT